MTTPFITGDAKASMETYWENDFTPLQAAGKAILRELREDEAGGDLHRRILSGGSHLYFSSSSNSSSNGSSTGIERFAHERSIPLPPHLQNEVKTVRYSLLMGLLPEANLAWMSVDDRLFLWNFEEQENFLDLKMASGQCIVSVGIAPPKKGEYSFVLLLVDVNGVLETDSTLPVLLIAVTSDDRTILTFTFLPLFLS
jgi:hypothetical protein